MFSEDGEFVTTIRTGTHFLDLLIGCEISHGAFGRIYVASDRKTGILWALKSAPIPAGRKTIEFEYHVLSHIQSSGYFPRIGILGRGKSFVFYTMELLGPSVSTIMKQQPNSVLDLGTAMRASYHILKSIESFHDMGFIHRDIKPGNILTREGTEYPMVLVDYGLSKVYLNPRNGKQKPKRTGIGVRGTRTYARVNALKSEDLSRRDDLISWFYTMIELILGYLPWSHLPSNTKEEMINVKEVVGMDDLVRDSTPELVGAWDEINELKFEDRPDYESLYSRLTRAMERIGVQINDPYPWNEQLKDQKSRLEQLLSEIELGDSLSAQRVEYETKCTDREGRTVPLLNESSPFSLDTDEAGSCPCCNLI